MRYLWIILLILVGALPSYSQDVLFKVIACSGGVTIDGKMAKSGMDVGSRGGLVRVPEYGYCAIVTHEGLVDVLRENILVADVPEFAHKPRFHSAFIPTIRLKFPFRPYRTIPVISDSLFIYWAAQGTLGDPLFYAPNNERFVVTFYNAQEEEVYSKKSTRNWTMLPTSTVLANDTVMSFNIRGYSPDMESEHVKINYADEKLKTFVTAHLNNLPQNDRLFYECAFYHSFELYLDQQWVIYKILKLQKTTTDPIFKNYLYYLRKEFGLEHVSLK